MAILFIKIIQYISLLYSAAPNTPQLASTQPSTCDDVNGNQFTLEWSPPNDTVGPSVEIEYYLVNVTGPPGFNCPPDQCNVTTNSTTITGLKCNTSYMVTVRAVNCIGEGSQSAPSLINVETPGR